MSRYKNRAQRPKRKSKEKERFIRRKYFLTYMNGFPVR